MLELDLGKEEEAEEEEKKFAAVSLCKASLLHPLRTADRLSPAASPPSRSDVFISALVTSPSEGGGWGVGGGGRKISQEEWNKY